MTTRPARPSRRAVRRLLPMLWLLAALAACSSGPSGPPPPPPLTELDFRYGTRDHMPPATRIVRVDADPAEVHAFLMQELREADAKDIEERTGLARRLALSDDSESVFERRRAVATAEWAAYGTRDRAAFDAIDRSPLALDEVQSLEDPEAFGSSITADVWSRKARFVTSTVSVTGDRRRESRRESRRPLASRIRFEIWGEPGAARTRVYVTAEPLVMGKAPGEGEKLPLKWLEFVDGHDEVRLVESYLRTLERW